MTHYTKFFAAILTILCLIGCATEASAATDETAEPTSAQATTMHLEKTEGTVDILNPEQEQIPTWTGMQLYSGYELETAKASQAWLSLDKTKAIKLAEESSAQVMQNNRHLELTLNAGALFFDIRKPLEEDETLQIRTSTMVAGIRGTSGWVWVIDENSIQIVLLDGSITVEDIHPSTGAVRQVTLEPGQILTIVNYGEDTELEEEDSIKELMQDGTITPDQIIKVGFGLRVEQLIEENVPQWVQKEVADSPQLQERIREDGILSVPRILGQEPDDPTPPAQAGTDTEDEGTDDTTTESAEESTTESTPGKLSQVLNMVALPDMIVVGKEYQTVTYYSEGDPCGSGSISWEVTDGDPRGLTIAFGDSAFIDITATKPGTYSITFTKAADDQYEAASTTMTFTADKSTPKVVITEYNGISIPDGTESLTVPYTDGFTPSSYRIEGLLTDEEIERVWEDSDGNAVTIPRNIGTYTLLASIEETDLHYGLDRALMFTLTIEKGDYPHTLSHTVYLTSDHIQGSVDVLDLFSQLGIPEGVAVTGVYKPASSTVSDVHEPTSEAIPYTGNPELSGSDTYTASLISNNYKPFEATLIIATTDKVVLEMDPLSSGYRTYDGTPYIGYDTLDLPGDYDGTLSHRYTGTAYNGTSYNSTTAPTNAGEYQVYISATGSDKYTDASAAADFNINMLRYNTPPDVNVNVDDPQNPVVTVTLGEMTLTPDDYELYFRPFDPTGNGKPGAYTVYIRAKHFNVSFPETEEAFTIGTATPSITVSCADDIDASADSITVRYTGSTPQLTLDVSGVKPGIDVIYTWLDSSGNEMGYPPYEVGTYTLLANVEETDYNYGMDNVPVVTLTIIQPSDYPHILSRTIYITPDTIDYSLHVANLFSYLTPPEGVMITGVSGPSSPTVVDLEYDSEFFTYTRTADPSGSDTYIFSLTSDEYEAFEATLIFEVPDKEVLTLWPSTDVTRFYDGTPYIGYDTLGLPEDYNGTVSHRYTGTVCDGSSYNSSDAPVNAGEYQVYISATGSDKYTDAAAVMEFAINVLEYTTAPTVTVNVDDPQNPAFTVTLDGTVLAPEDYSLSFSPFDPTGSGESGEYTVYVSNANPNITFPTAEATFAIGIVTPSITVSCADDIDTSADSTPSAIPAPIPILLTMSAV